MSQLPKTQSQRQYPQQPGTSTSQQQQQQQQQLKHPHQTRFVKKQYANLKGRGWVECVPAVPDPNVVRLPDQILPKYVVPIYGHLSSVFTSVIGTMPLTAASWTSCTSRTSFPLPVLQTTFITSDSFHSTWSWWCFASRTPLKFLSIRCLTWRATSSRKDVLLEACLFTALQGFRALRRFALRTCFVISGTRMNTRCACCAMHDQFAARIPGLRSSYSSSSKRHILSRSQSATTLRGGKFCTSLGKLNCSGNGVQQLTTKWHGSHQEAGRFSSLFLAKSSNTNTSSSILAQTRSWKTRLPMRILLSYGKVAQTGYMKKGKQSLMSGTNRKRNNAEPSHKAWRQFVVIIFIYIFFFHKYKRYIHFFYEFFQPT